MTDFSPEVIAFDASKTAYLPIVGEATAAAGWRMLPYDSESFAIEDLEESPPTAVVAVLHREYYAYAHYEGRKLLEVAKSRRVPYAVVALEEADTGFQIVKPNLFIPRTERVVSSIFSWLVRLQAQSPNNPQ